jgi:type I restriction enzyme M protein
MISLDELESVLWGAAVLLRGKINATGYKEYIFPLVFFKRICDVHAEERARALELSGGDEEFAAQPDNYSFAIPAGCFWEDVRAVTENIGQALVTAWTRIEQANPARVVLDRVVEGLTGIFGKRDHWTNKNVLTDATLSELIEHFSRLDLSLANCPADEMGTAYEYLVGKFADDAGHTAQEFYTNRTVVELMAEILHPRGGESVYDPTCGTGGMLVSCIAHCAKQRGNWREIKAYGQEQNALTSAIARMNLFLHGIEEFRIVNDDTLERPAFLHAGRLRTFDVVLANPPYSIKQWNRDLFANDPYGRNFLGTPPQGRADYAFIQHILKSMDPKTGRCAILLPHGVLFREEEREMRRNLIESDLLEAVIGLGPNLFYNSPMEACVMICRADKPAQAKDRVLFINAVNEVTRKNASSNLEPKHIAKILAAYAARTSDGVFSHDATRAEIAARGDSLAISLYAHAASVDSGEKIDLAAALAVFAESSASSSEALDRYVAAVGGQSASLVAAPAFPSVANLSEKCGDLCKVKFGDIAVNSVAKKKPEETDLPHYIGLEHIDSGSFTVSRWGGDVVPIGDKLVMKKGDVLFGKRRAYQRKVAIAPFDGIFSAHGMVLRPKTDVIDARYFPFFIASDQFLNEAIRISVGGLSPTINWKTLKECEFSLPPIDRQRELADLLWAANDLKEAYKKAISATDEMLKAKFREMFGEVVNNSRGWPEQPIRAFAQVRIGPFGSVLHAEDYITGGHFIINPCHMGEKGFEPDMQQTVSDQKFFELSAYRLKAGDVVLGRRGDIGRCVLMEQDNVLCGTGSLFIRIFADVCDAHYLIRVFRDPQFKSRLEDLAIGTTMKNINAGIVENLLIPLPPPSLQQEFVAIAGAAEETKAALKRSLTDLEQVMKGLING